MKHQIEMHLERETKGAIMYSEPNRQEGDPQYLIGNLYLRKAYLRKNNGGAFPITITVTIEEQSQ